MPIIDVEIVVAPNAPVDADLAQSLADAAGLALGSPAGQTWVRLHLLAREHYAENEFSLASTELPVFVTVLKRALPGPAEMTDEITRLTGSVANLLRRNRTCVHVEYAPAASGRLAFGGKLVTSPPL
jgi:phenylpyruvate tautomerase PptA (4-oxalocrotonate tautomerase family)